MKRKTDAGYQWTGRPVEITQPRERGQVALRCIWYTRLVIESQQVPSGTRYDFQPGQVQGVQAIDAETLLAKHHVQTACCGAVVSPVIKMFERVI